MRLSRLFVVMALVGLGTGCQRQEAARPSSAPLKTEAPPPSGPVPLISPEFPLALPVTDAAPWGQYHASAAWDGNQFLVVWSDDRTGLGEIFGTRLSPFGEVLDPQGFRISRSPAATADPKVVFTGSSFLVIWIDLRSGRGQVYGTRVTSDGEAMDAADRAYTTAPNGVFGAALAQGSAQPLLVYALQAPADLWAILINDDGTANAPVVVCDAPSTQQDPQLAFGGGEFVVVWSDYRNGNGDIYGARLGPSGELLQPDLPIAVVPRSQQHPTVAYDGEAFTVVWEDFRTVGNENLWAGRVFLDGGVTPDAGIELFTTAKDQSFPQLAFDGPRGWMTWEDERASGRREIYAARLAPGGAMVEPSGFLVRSLPGGNPRPWVLAPGTAAARLFWAETDGLSEHIYTHAFLADGGPAQGAPLLVSTSANGQATPAVASDGRRYLATWIDTQRGRRRVYAVRISEEGEVLDLPPLELSGASGNSATPAVAGNADGFLVAWADDRSGNTDVYGARVATDGRVLDPGGFPIAERTLSGMFAVNEQSPRVASDGTDFLVAWDVEYGGANEVAAARILADGTVSDPDGGLWLTSSQEAVRPDVAFAQGRYGIVWRQQSSTSEELHLSRVDPLSGPLDPIPVHLRQASPTGSFSYGRPAITGDETGARLAWYGGEGSVFGIYGVPFDLTALSADPGGGPVLDLDTILYANSGNTAHRPALAWDGVESLLGYQDGLDTGADLRALVVSPNGTPRSAKLDVSTSPDMDAELQLASLRPGRWLAVYTRYDPVAPFGAPRVRGRLISTDGVEAWPDGGPVGLGDAGFGEADAGQPDAGSGTQDAGTTDAGTGSGESDAGTGRTDAGTESDAGTGETDAGTEADAGTLTDAGTGETDGGEPDAGEPDAGPGAPHDYSVGCGCGGAPGSAGVPLLGLALGLTAWRRRLRRAA